MTGQTTIDGGPTLSRSVDAQDHSQGPDDASVTLVQYGDYECAHCGRAYPIVRSIQDELGDRLRFVFRNFPLTTIHAHAQHAAEAAEAAGAQGEDAFWAMHDHLYEHQNALTDDDLQQYARDLDLDVERFEREVFEEHTYADRVWEDFVSGVRSGVKGTPTFFVNGVRYEESWDHDTLFATLEERARPPE